MVDALPEPHAHPLLFRLIEADGLVFLVLVSQRGFRFERQVLHMLAWRWRSQTRGQINTENVGFGASGRLRAAWEPVTKIGLPPPRPKKSKISLSIWPPLASATRMRRHIACLLTLLPCGSPRPPLVTCDTATLTAARKNNMTRIVTCVVGGTFCSLSHLASLHDVFVVCGRCACRSELPQGSQAPDVRVGEEPSNSGDCLAEPHHCAASRYAL